MVFVRDDIAGVMGGEPDLYLVVYIGPQRMMIHFFRCQRYAGHKGKCRGKVLELEFPVELIVFFFPHMIRFYCMMQVRGQGQNMRCPLFLIFSWTSSITSCTTAMLLMQVIRSASLSSATVSPFSSHKKSRCL